MNVNAKYGFGSSSVYANATGEEIIIQIQYLKNEIEKYEIIINDLRKQLQIMSKADSGAPVNSVEFQSATNKLADAINQQTKLKQSLDAAMVQRDIYEQQKMSAAQSGAISNKLGVETTYGSSAPPAPSSAPSSSMKKPLIGNNIFGYLLLAAAAFGVYLKSRKTPIPLG